MNDLLAQLTATIEEAERNRVDAEKWRQLLYQLQQLGYGPRITPVQVAEIIGYLIEVNRRTADLQANTQEQVAADHTAGCKMLRRKLRPGDEAAIEVYIKQGIKPDEIARQLGLTSSAVGKYFDQLAQDA